MPLKQYGVLKGKTIGAKCTAHDFLDTVVAVLDLTSRVRFPPLFGQVFSGNKLMDLCLVSSFRSRFSCIGLPPRERAVPRGSSFGLGGVSELRSRIGYTGRSSVGPYLSRHPIHPKCTSAGVRRPRLWCRRAVL